MSLNPDKRLKKNGIYLRYYNIEKELFIRTAPSIYIFWISEMEIKNTTISEAILREGVFGRIPLIADYYVDNKSIWFTTPPRLGRQLLFICGDPIAAKDNVIKMLRQLIEEYKLKDSDIRFMFKTKQYEQDIRNSIKESCYEEEIKPIEFEPDVPRLDVEFLQNNQWNAVAAQATPIIGIKITPNYGAISYRVHLFKNGWTNWVTNGIECGGGVPIDGFQYKYDGDLQLYHCCEFCSGGTTRWTNKMPPMQYNKCISNIKFELK